MIGLNEIRQAAVELSPGGLKLYLYLAENVDGFDFWLSPKDVMTKYNMSKSTYDRAKRELIDKKYLAIGENNNIYFYANKEDNKMEDQTYEEAAQQLNLTYNKLAELDEELADSYVEKSKDLLISLNNTDKKAYIMKLIGEMQREIDNKYSKSSKFDSFL